MTAAGILQIRIRNSVEQLCGQTFQQTVVKLSNVLER